MPINAVISSKDPPHDLPAALSKIYTSGNVNMFEECFPSSAEKPRKDAIVGEGVCIIILDMRLRQSQLVGAFRQGSENIRLDVVYGIGRVCRMRIPYQSEFIIYTTSLVVCCYFLHFLMHHSYMYICKI